MAWHWATNVLNAKFLISNCYTDRNFGSNRPEVIYAVFQLFTNWAVLWKVPHSACRSVCLRQTKRSGGCLSEKTSKSPASEPARTPVGIFRSASSAPKNSSGCAGGGGGGRSRLSLDHRIGRDLLERQRIRGPRHCPADRLATGRAYADLLDADNFTTATTRSCARSTRMKGDGIPFQIEYLFRPNGRNGKTILLARGQRSLVCGRRRPASGSLWHRPAHR